MRPARPLRPSPRPSLDTRARTWCMSSPTRQESPLWHRIARAITEGPTAWHTPRQLAVQLRLDVEQLTDELADMDLAGWLAVWERPDDVAVTLSPLTAARFRVRLATGRHGGSRWIAAGGTERPPEQARGGLYRQHEPLRDAGRGLKPKSIWSHAWGTRPRTRGLHEPPR
jgi:hypothetical protein